MIREKILTLLEGNPKLFKASLPYHLSIRLIGLNTHVEALIDSGIDCSDDGLILFNQDKKFQLSDEQCLHLTSIIAALFDLRLDLLEIQNKLKISESTLVIQLNAYIKNYNSFYIAHRNFD